MKRIRNDTYFDVVDAEELFSFGKRVVQVEYIDREAKFLVEVMYEEM